METNSQWFFKNSREEGHNRFIQLFTISLVLCLVTQSWTTLCDAMDHSPPGSTVHGDSPGKILEWVAMLSSTGFSQPRVSCVAGGFFTSWATQEAHHFSYSSLIPNVHISFWYYLISAWKKFLSNASQ